MSDEPQQAPEPEPVPAATQPGQPAGPPVTPGLPQMPASERVRLAAQRRGESEYIFRYWSALGWTIFTFGIYVFYQLVRRMRDHNAPPRTPRRGDHRGVGAGRAAGPATGTGAILPARRSSHGRAVADDPRLPGPRHLAAAGHRGRRRRNRRVRPARPRPHQARPGRSRRRVRAVGDLRSARPAITFS